MSKQIILITNMLTSTERMTVTDGARGDDKRNSSALSTEMKLLDCISLYLYLTTGLST